MKTKTQCYKGWNEGHFYSLLKWICTGRDSWKALDLHVTTAFSSVQSSHSVMSDTLRPPRLQHIRLPCPSPVPGVYSNSCPLSRWCHPAISSSVVSFFWLQFCPASGSFLMSQLFTSGGQSIAASTSVLPMNIQGWFPLGLTGLISLLSKELSRVFSNATVQNHQFFSAQLSLRSNSRIHTWLLEKHSFH